MTDEAFNLDAKSKGRVFILGNGPSLAWTPLDRLIGEEAWSAARIHLIYPETDWRPTRHWRSDHPQNQQDMDDAIFHMEQGYDCWYRSDVCEIITGEYIPRGEWRPEPRVLPGHVHSWDYCIPHCAGVVFRTDGADDPRRPDGWHLDELPPNTLCKYGSSVNVMLQQAFREGYNPIYLLGCDLGFQATERDAMDPSHFTKDYHSRTVEHERAIVDNATHRDFHRHAQEYCAARGVFILNASLGGHLLDDIYPKVPFETLFR